MNTVSGQFIEFNGDNGQYYLDLKKDIDYDKKIQEKADFLGDDALDRHFFDIMVSTLNYQDTEKYVPGFNIYSSSAEQQAMWPGSADCSQNPIYVHFPVGLKDAFPLKARKHPLEKWEAALIEHGPML